MNRSAHSRELWRDDLGNPDAHLRPAIWNLTLVAGGLAIALVYAGFARPIWIDEFLHFATGAMSFVDVLRTIDYTTIEINHGQTGTYILIDWVLLQIVGASSWALRLPSLLASGLLLWSAVIFIRSRQLGRPWELLVLLGLAGHHMLMVFTGDARPYMPLAASTIAMLTYFCADSLQRASATYRAVGVLGVVVGALMQAYWVFFLMLILMFAAFLQVSVEKRRVPIRQLAAVSCWKLSVFGVLLSLVVGQLTWMRKSAAFGYEPFSMIGGPERAIRVFWSHHITAQAPPALWWMLLALASVVILSMWRQWHNWLPPVVLLIMGLSSSVALALVSMSRGYWLFDRQWVAGMALVSVATTWLIGQLFSTSGALVWLRYALAGLYVLTVLWSVSLALGWVATSTQVWNSQLDEFSSETRSAVDLMEGASDQDAVYAANVNIARRGAVWPEFTAWYRGQSGMRAEFREVNPSWTMLLFGPGDWYHE